jgi:hypothetical protein
VESVEELHERARTEHRLAQELVQQYRDEFARFGKRSARMSILLRNIARPALEAEAWLDQLDYLIQCLEDPGHPSDARNLARNRAWRVAFGRGGTTGVDEIITRAETEAAGRMLEFLGVNNG